MTLYVGNNSNIVRDADVSATNIVASKAIFRTDTDPKDGGGSVLLTGPYSGQHDTTIDVEITDVAGDTSNISQPIFSGGGNGTLTDIAATGLDAQQIVVALQDLGSETRTAYANFQGVTLVAKASGDGGNAITVSVDNSALTRTDTAYALQEDLRAGTTDYLGDQWNFGAATLDAQGKLPANPSTGQLTAPRLSFGDDPQVYYAFRKFVNGAYVYGFSPAPVRDVPAGSKVYAVTGTHTITIVDGPDDDTLTGIKTLYEALNAIQGGSTLVAVPQTGDQSTPIVNDRTPGGMGAVELSVWTTSYVVGITRDGGDSIKNAILSVLASSAAPSETLTITCTSAATTGSETWVVRGTNSGRLADAQTAVPYGDGPYAFTIPLPEINGADPGQVTGGINVEYSAVNRSANERIPTLCVVQPRLGSAAHNGTFQYRLTARPPEDCDCTSAAFSGGPSVSCLGIVTSGGDDVSDASRLIRVQRLKTAVRTLIASNTSPIGQADPDDIAWIETSAKIFQDALALMESGDLNPDPWVATHEFAIDEIVAPTVPNGYRYAVTIAGTSGSTEPGSWTTTVGATTTSGGVTFTNIGKTAYGIYDEAFEAWKTDAATINTLNEPQYLTYGSGLQLSKDMLVVPPRFNGHYYAVYALQSTKDSTTTAPKVLTTGATEPLWPTSSGGIVVQYVNATDSENFDEISFKEMGTYTDYATSNIPDAFFERYRSAMAEALAAAGIDSDFDHASVNGDGCWRDFNDSTMWWVPTDGGPYLPVQTGHYYHSAIKSLGPDGKPIYTSTHEFGFGAKFGCPDLLREGDLLTVTLSVTAGGSVGHGYQEGDNFRASVNHAQPIQFGGGQTGDDTLTFSVVGDAVGGLAPYALVTTALAPYSDGGLSFQITPGGIPFQLGDRWLFSIEGGHFRWRRDGGAWSSDIDIGTTLLADGLSAAFQNGASPSWQTGDRWSFSAEAFNGPDGLRQPTDARLTWTGSTAIVVAPVDAEAVTGCLIADHTIPSDATIVLQGSDDNFATTPTSIMVPWQRDHIWIPVTATRAKWRLTVNRGGSIQWLYLGNPLSLLIRTGVAELGKLKKQRRLPGITARRALGVTIDHDALTQESVDALLDLLDHACQNDERRFAVVPNPAEPAVALVEFTADSLELTDLFDFQPRDIADRLIGASMTLSAVP